MQKFTTRGLDYVKQWKMFLKKSQSFIYGGCFVSSITSSCNYINAIHHDVDDSCKGIVTWTFDGDMEPTDWYFILPNLSVDGEKTTIIKLHHGMSIKLMTE